MTNQQGAPEALRPADALDGNATTNWTREEAAAELRRLLADNAHADRYAEQLGRDLAKATAEIADLRAHLEAAPLMGSAGDAGWRDHVEQRLLTWRQSFVNRSGDQLALDDFMDKQSIDDLIDFVCSEFLQGCAPSSAKGVAHG